MQISYDDGGRILAVSMVDGILGGENIVTIAEEKAPPDLLESFARGAYVVRKGKLEAAKNPPAALESERRADLSAVLRDAIGEPPKRRSKK